MKTIIKFRIVTNDFSQINLAFLSFINHYFYNQLKKFKKKFLIFGVFIFGVDTIQNFKVKDIFIITYKRNFDIKIYDNIMIETLKEKKNIQNC